MNVRISVLGCSLMDYLYSPVSFSSKAFETFSSKVPADGGIELGKIVFTEDLERYSGKDIEDIITDLVGDAHPKAINIGGPGIVSAICAAQLLPEDCTLSFYGGRGSDRMATLLMEKLASFPLNVEHLVRYEGDTATTYVLSDPSYADGYGERTFIFNIGVLKDIAPVDIPENCFDADIVMFSATAVMPKIHAQLDLLLERSRQAGALTIVTTVFDLLHEREAPHKRWTLGSGESTFPLIDLLVCDREEALRLSGTEEIFEALAYFKHVGVKATIITQGKDDVLAYASGGPFSPFETTRFPVSSLVDAEIHDGKAADGDTTGCGDNFAGGVLASIAMQKGREEQVPIHLEDAIAWGIAAGGAACFHLGGTYTEDHPGQKRDIVERYYHHYKGGN